MASSIPVEALRAAWGGLAAKYGAYRLTLPGDPTFVCAPQTCEASCCRNFNVALDEDEAARLCTASGLDGARFLESEGGEPLALPLARPFVLARREGHCVFLDDDLACAQYEARPDACRSYPHQVVFVAGADGRAVRPTAAEGRGAVEALAAGATPAGAMPLLLRHEECPGFTGPPMTEAAWARLLRETYALAVGGAGEVVSSPP